MHWLPAPPRLLEGSRIKQCKGWHLQWTRLVADRSSEPAFPLALPERSHPSHCLPKRWEQIDEAIPDNATNRTSAARGPFPHTLPERMPGTPVRRTNREPGTSAARGLSRQDSNVSCRRGL